MRADKSLNWLDFLKDDIVKPEAELSLFWNYSLSSSTLSSKNNRRYSKKMCKKQVRLFWWRYMINDIENETKNER